MEAKQTRICVLSCKSVEMTRKRKSPLQKLLKKKKNTKKSPHFFVPVISVSKSSESFLGKWEGVQNKRSSLMKCKSETNLVWQ